MEPKRAKVLRPAKFHHLLRITEATSRIPERDNLVLLLGVACGMRVAEIARLEVHHVLTKSAIRRTEVAFRGLPRDVELVACSSHTHAQSKHSTGMLSGGIAVVMLCP